MPGGAPKRSGRAVAALVLGIAGVVLCFLVVPAILAIVFGFLARRDISRSEGRIEGGGMATAGIVLGVVGVLVGAGLYIAAALGAFDDIDDLDDDSVTADFEVGDCVEVPEGDFFFRLSSQDCAQPHEGEVYRVAELPAAADDEYPGTADVQEQIGQSCVAEFETYIGTPYGESALDFAFVYPTRQQWEDGDRGYLCIAFDPGGDLVESVAGSGR